MKICKLRTKKSFMKLDSGLVFEPGAALQRLVGPSGANVIKLFLSVIFVIS